MLSSAELARAIDELARQIAEGRPNAGLLSLVGIRTRGLPLAERLVQRLGDLAIPDVGAIDVTLYRDDLSGNPHRAVLRGTEIPFAVDGSAIVLVDDVLFTGRTVRAALDELCDLGRPASVRLAVLVDRGFRELPIQPDYAALRIETERTDRVEVRFVEFDGVDEVRRR